MNEKLTSAIDKLLGLNSTAVVALGAALLGAVFVGGILGDYDYRFREIERIAKSNAACASIAQCEAVAKLLHDLRERVARIEGHRGMTP